MLKSVSVQTTIIHSLNKIQFYLPKANMTWKSDQDLSLSLTHTHNTLTTKTKGKKLSVAYHHVKYE